MATETAQTLKSRSTTVALKTQTAIGTFNTPGTDYLPCANLSLTIGNVEIENAEYTGSIEGNPPEVERGEVSLTFTAMLRGPGGADVPAAGAFILGRLLTAAKMTEQRITTAVPVAPEALSSGTTGGFTGGAGMAATADLYRGLLVHLPAIGALPRGLIGVRSNTAAKVVTLARLLSSAASGNYQFPKQLVYSSNLSSTNPLPTSFSAWVGGKRYDIIDASVSSCSINVPTTGRTQGENPTITVTFTGRLHNYVDEAAPAVPAAGSIPKFRDGQQHLANTYVAGSGFTLEFGATSEAPPDPNKPDGSGASELVALQRTIAMNIQGYTKADFDTIALADGKARHPFFAAYGAASGNFIGIIAADVRLGYSAPDIGGNIATESPTLYVDPLDKNVNIIFPYW